MEYERFREKVAHLQSDISQFKVEFLDRESFKRFADDLWSNICNYPEVCITGYFSETIRENLIRYVQTQGHRLRLICPELNVDNKRDKKNLEVLRKLSKARAEIKVNNRLHARILLAYTPLLSSSDEVPKCLGLLILGSFDFNTECIGKERFDAGIKTCHPDLVLAVSDLFEQIWNEPESTPLSDQYPEKKE